MSVVNEPRGACSGYSRPEPDAIAFRLIPNYATIFESSGQPDQARINNLLVSSFERPDGHCIRRGFATR